MSDQYKTREEKRKLAQKNKKQKKQSKGLVKRIAVILLMLCIVAAIAVGGVFAYYISTAPAIDEESLIDPISSKIYDKNGDIYTEIGSETRDYVEYKDIPKLMENAVLAIEDVRFYKHHGIDIIRVGGAIVANITGGFGSQGGSTITQQVVKNSFLQSEKTIKRKVQEMYLAFQLEQEYSKEQIFEMYVNKVYMSSGIHGFSTASKLYFGKELSELTLAEAATLAGMPQSPNNYNPFDHPEKAEKRRNIVLQAMENADFITAEQRKAAQAESLTDSLVAEGDREETKTKFNAIVDQVIEEVEELTDYNIYTDGLSIYTSIDPKAQELMETILDSDKYIAYPDDKFQVGSVFMDTKTGEIYAIGGGRKQEVARGFNYATDLKTRQPGSTIKPLLDYAPAFEYLNWSTYHPLVDEEYQYSSGQTVGTAYSSYRGQVSLREALYMSYNVPAVKTLQEVGTDKAGAFVKKLGIDFGDIYESSAIGGVSKGASPLQMAGAYAAFGNEGVYTKPHVIKKIVLRDNDTVHETAPESEAAMKDSTAFMVTDILKDVMTKGTGTQANISGVPVAGKTGTTNYSAEDRAKYNIDKSQSPDSWFVGYTTNFTMSVWTGYDNQFENTLGKNETKIAQKIFKAMMQEMSAGVDTEDFKQPSSVVQLPIEKGSNPAVIASEHTPDSQKVYEYFIKGHEPTATSTKYEKLAAPSGLTAAYDEQANKINVSWNYDNEAGAEFDVKVAVNGGSPSTLTTTSDMSFSMNSPEVGSTYVFSVTAKADGRESDPASVSVTIEETVTEEEPAEEENPPAPETDEEQDPAEEGNPDSSEDGSNPGNEENPGTEDGSGDANEDAGNTDEGNGNGNGNGNENDPGTGDDNEATPRSETDESASRSSTILPVVIRDSFELQLKTA